MIAAGDIEGKREDLSMVFPWLVRDPKPLDEMMGDAIDAVVSASSQGHITEVEAEVLLSEILAAWASQSIMENGRFRATGKYIRFGAAFSSERPSQPSVAGHPGLTDLRIHNERRLGKRPGSALTHRQARRTGRRTS